MGLLIEQGILKALLGVNKLIGSKEVKEKVVIMEKAESAYSIFSFLMYIYKKKNIGVFYIF